MCVYVCVFYHQHYHIIRFCRLRLLMSQSCSLLLSLTASRPVLQFVLHPPLLMSSAIFSLFLSLLFHLSIAPLRTVVNIPLLFIICPPNSPRNVFKRIPPYSQKTEKKKFLDSSAMKWPHLKRLRKLRHSTANYII